MSRMKIINKIKEKGISLRVAHIIMAVVIILITMFLFGLTFFSAKTFTELSTVTNNYIEMKESAEILMDASDYLTQEVQCYTVTCEIEHFDNYFVEANQVRRREKALKVLKELADGTEALRQLENAMNESVSLMDREYYAMLLVLTADGIEYRPQEMAELTLTPEDAALSADMKKELARGLVHDRVYFEKRNAIHANMERCLNELDDTVHAAQVKANRRMRTGLDHIRILGVIQMMIVLTGVLMNKLLGTDPLVKSVQQIRNDDPLPITGSTEFRYLAGAYNKMLAAMKEDLSMLNFRASHDKLTGVYNRAGYEIISTGLEMKTTTMILVDIDNFKHVNDGFSHPVGDKVLQKLARILVETFRSHDFVCRIGGDEFAIFLLQTNEASKDAVINKIAEINKRLADTSDGLPPISISAGCVLGEDDMDAGTMLKHADVAMYRVKDNGKNGCAYYK